MSFTLDYLQTMSYGVVSILGSGKTFKSGTMYSLFDYVPALRDRRKAFLNFSGLDTFPAGYGVEISSVWEAEPDSILVIEDANRLFPSRASGKSSDLQEFLGIISHKDILIFLTVQNTANTDMAFFRDQDSILIHKRMSPSAICYERPEIASSCLDANAFMGDFCSSSGVDFHLVSYVPRFQEILVLEDPPSWYGWEQSHALRNYLPADFERSRGRA